MTQFFSKPTRNGLLFRSIVMVVLFLPGFIFLLSIEGQSNPEKIYFPLVSQPLSEDIHWNKSAAPFTVTSAQAVVAEVMNQEYLYLIGGGSAINGQNGRTILTNRVNHAPIYEDGALGEWSGVGSRPALPEIPLKLYGFSATAVDNLIYVLGGITFPAGGSPMPIYNNSVYCAELTADGTFTHWENLDNHWNFPANYRYEPGVAYHATVFFNGRLYLIGGLRRNLYYNNPWQETDYVYSADVGASCQALEWREEDDLPLPLRGHTAVATDQAIYLFNGLTGGDPEAISFRTELDPVSLRIKEWEPEAKMPDSAGVYLSTAVRSGNYIYLIGGLTTKPPNDSIATSSVYRARILAGGQLEQWRVMNPLEEGRYGHTAVSSSDDRLYVIGGAAKASPAALPTVRDTIFWTPLLFFTKQASTDELVWAGQEISYEIKVVSNNVRDLHDLVLTDNLPDNFQVYDAPDFSQDGQILTWSIPELLIGHHVVKVIYGLVGSPETPTTPQAARDAVPISTEIVLTPTSEQEAQPTAVLSRPTVDPKICEIPDIYPQSGTPRPKPTCTPTPPITVTVTITDTAVPPPGDTPTPTPVPVVLVNQATLCFVQLCWQTAPVVNATYKTFLPLAIK